MELTLEEKRWLASLKPFDRGNRNALHAVFALFGEPHTYLDLGCGTGAMVRLAKALGMYAIGVDILPHPEPFFVKHNLKEPLNLQTTFDLITCIETAEHLPEEAADTLCDTLAFHLMGDGVYTSGLLVFTAAAPGQPGDGHLNCKSKEYWREKLGARGIKYDRIATERLARAWEQTQMVTHWLEENLQVFSR